MEIPLINGKNVQNGKLVCKFETYIPESIFGPNVGKIGLFNSEDRYLCEEHVLHYLKI
jgi:hypothetical protein